MFTISVPHKLKVFGIALAVPLSLFLTLTAVVDLPPVQANHHPTAMLLAPHDPFSGPISQLSLTDPSAPADSAEVSISGSAFNPAIITITAGTVVTWTNFDLFAHTVTSDVGSSDPWDSGSLGQGGVFTRTFNIPGTYGYHCEIHPFMQGMVVVLAQQPPQAPLELSVTGPSGGAADIAHAFTAGVSPITATQPITYLWQATGQTSVTHADKGLSDTLSFTWPAADVGPQLITVTAENSAGSVSATYAITVVPPTAAGVTDVTIVDFAFQPQAITISVGSSIRWINAGLQPHTTTSDVSSSEVWDSGQLDPGEVFTRTFNTPGSYAYLCAIHPGMTGTVAVRIPVYLPLVLR
jgi:plastocyanin